MAICQAYTFALTLIKLNCDIYVEKPREISNIFMKEFILDKFNNEGRYLGDNYCINNQNINQCIINLNSINNNLDLSMNDKSQKIIDYYISKIASPSKNLISHDSVFTFIIGIHDRIRYLSEKYLTDGNQYNQEKFKYQILTNSSYFWNYINGNADSEPLLKTEFFKSIIIKIFSCCSHIYYYNKDFKQIASSINNFDNLSKKLNINENTPSYELVFKVKGDYYFKNNDYKSSIDCYNKTIRKMNDKNPKKSIVFFNLGVLYYYTGDKNSAIENMKIAADYFKKYNEEKSSFEFHKRNNMMMKKHNLALYIIKQIQNN
jgi:tetratricopeptide (TPR) repeat protein